jgi:hypothetical protein
VKGNAPAAAPVVVLVLAAAAADDDKCISRPNDKTDSIRMFRRFKLSHVNILGWTNARN